MDSDLIVKMMHSYKLSYLLFYAAEKHIFDYLIEPVSADDICNEMKLSSPSKMEIILNLFAGYGIIDKRNNLYSLKKEFAGLLCSQSKESVIPLLNLEKYLMQHHNRYDDFVKAIEGNVKDDFNDHGKESMEGTYGQAMENGGRFASLQISRIFRSIKKKNPKILDIGGGKGSYSISIMKCCPEAKIHIFERKEMEEECIKNIKKENLLNNITFKTVDIIKDEVEEKYDGILISNVLHLYDYKTIEKIIEKVSKSLEDGGILILHDFFLNDNHIEPILPLLFTIDWFMIGADFNYSQGDIQRMLQPFGLEFLESKHYAELPTSVLVFEKKW